jgi:PiT family inorganic phosphate transporter
MLADRYHLPVSTTQILSSGIAGTMYANRSGLQMGTIRNVAIAWVLTLPIAILLSGLFFILGVSLFPGTGLPNPAAAVALGSVVR